MITVEDFMRAVEYRITGGSPYLWTCYGPDARYLDSDGETYSASVIFDGNTVYEAMVWDNVHDRVYRLIDPDFKDQMFAESRERGLDPTVACDSVKYIDLDSDDDWLEKTTAIVNGIPYDDRVSIPIDLSDEELFELMKTAHECDVTLNQLIEKILLEHINHEKNHMATPTITSNKKRKKKNKKKTCEVSCGNYACDEYCIESGE